MTPDESAAAFVAQLGDKLMEPQKTSIRRMLRAVLREVQGFAPTAVQIRQALQLFRQVSSADESHKALWAEYLFEYFEWAVPKSAFMGLTQNPCGRPESRTSWKTTSCGST